MRRGTTPTITITTDLDLTGASNLFVTFKQGTRLVMEKTLSDVKVSENAIVCRLSQSDTLALKENKEVQFQIRATLGDQKVASNIMTSTADAILKDGEI